MLETARTTIRLTPQLKKAAQQKALELDISFQDLVTDALQKHLRQLSKAKARKIVFNTHDLKEPLNNLTREEIYAD